MAILSVRIDKKLERDLERIAKAKGLTKSQLVRDMLRRMSTLELFELARQELVPHAERIGWLTDEDIFRDIS